MKLLFESWRGYITEVNSRESFKCPPLDPYGKAYYRIDNKNPPSIEQILDCWVESRGYVYDSNVNTRKPAYYSTEELVPFREYKKEKLRRIHDSEEYQELKSNIQENGIREPIMIEFGKNGIAKIGEGNHRHQIAMELGIEVVPVRFIFQEKVTKGAAPIEEPMVKAKQTPEIEDDTETKISDEELKKLFKLLGL